MESCHPVSTPVDCGKEKLLNFQCQKTEGDKTLMAMRPYWGLVGFPMYLVVVSRSDIPYIIKLPSQFVEDPGKPHWKAGVRVLQYIKGTLNAHLRYHGEDGGL